VTLHQEQVTGSPHIISSVSIGRFTTMHFKSSRFLAVTARLPIMYYNSFLAQNYYNNCMQQKFPARPHLAEWQGGGYQLP